MWALYPTQQSAFNSDETPGDSGEKSDRAENIGGESGSW